MRTQVQPDIERPEQAELSADTRTAATPVVTLPAEEESQEALSLVPGQNRNGVLIYQVPAERVAQDGAVPPDTVAEIQGGRSSADLDGLRRDDANVHGNRSPTWGLALACSGQGPYGNRCCRQRPNLAWRAIGL